MDGTRLFSPAHDLKPFIWVYLARDESARSGAPTALNHFPSTVSPSLSILLQGRVAALCEDHPPRLLPTLFLTSAVTHPVVSANVGEVTSLTILFRPGVLPSFTGERTAELVNGFVDAEAIWPHEAPALQAQVAGLTADVALPFVENFLRRVISRSYGRPTFSDAQRIGISTSLAHHAIGEVAARTGVSLRQFERRFVAQYGMTPKLYQQLRRFERAALALRDECDTRIKTLASLAAECGYADQSHLVKEFQRFSGHCPTLLQRNVSDDPDFWVYRMRLVHE